MKLKSYPKYKDSGIQWIGEIPEGWEVRRIKTIFYEINKQSITGAEELLSVSDIYGIKKRSEIIGPDDHLTHAETLIGYKKCKKEDLVMNIMLAWKGAIGVSAYDGIVSPAYCVYRIKNHNPKYFHYLFRVNLFTNQFKRYSSGIIDSRLRLYPEEFFRIETIVPPFPEQTAIANFLDKKTAEIDALIEKDKRLIELLKERRTALINHAVTKGLDPNAKMKDSGVEWIGKISEEWEVGRLKNKIGLKYGSSLSELDRMDGNIKVFGSNGIVGKHNKSITKGMTIIIGRKGSYGKINLSDASCFPIDTTYFIDKSCTKFNLKYLSYLLTQLKLDETSRDSAVPGLSRDVVYNKIIPYISIEDQTAIANFLDKATAKIDKTIQKIEDKIKLLEEYKKSSIHHVVTGKVDVRGVVA